MSKLSNMKDTLKQLELLGLPISEEQKRVLAKAEDEHIEETIIPKIKEEINGLFTDIDIKARVIVEYNGTDVKVYLETEEEMMAKESQPRRSAIRKSASGLTKRTSKPSFIKLTYPDGHQQMGKGVDMLRNLINDIGPGRVHDTGITSRGIRLVEDHVVERLRDYQRPINDGYFLMTNTNQAQKKQQIKDISDYFGLGLKVDIVDEKGNDLN